VPTLRARYTNETVGGAHTKQTDSSPRTAGATDAQPRSGDTLLSRWRKPPECAASADLSPSGAAHREFDYETKCRPSGALTIGGTTVPGANAPGWKNAAPPGLCSTGT